MPLREPRNAGWQGAILVGITYVYFLIFAQFAFLQRLAELEIAAAHLKAAMAAMALGGVLFSLLSPRLKLCPSPAARLRIGLGACAAMALVSLLPLGFAACLAVAFLIGAALGLLTVTLVTHLRQWVGNWFPLLSVGLGTGIGYLVCNFPPLFTASPKVQAAIAGGLCLAGICLPLRPVPEVLTQKPAQQRRPISFVRVVGCFTALVWLDSAAFFIIQNTPGLKAGTWEGSVHLWVNGFLHLAAALASAWFLRRRGLSPVLIAAFVALGGACLLLTDPNWVLLASVFYPIGVSLYSVALVAYPALVAPAASVAERGRKAGWIYAIAGWGGSAMGIGMGQNLGHVPPLFVMGAGAVVLLAWPLSLPSQRRREIAVTAVVLVAAFLVEHLLPSTPRTAPLTQIERGRQVYISEGCINCHSQYVRPNTADVLLWGPAETMQELRNQRPPLIGNRRQGPDLAEVGGRRSALWLNLHFHDPAEVSGASIMPSYAFLFRDGRGDDLVAYLASLRGAGAAEHRKAELEWRPSADAVSNASAGKGRQVFQLHCATCHDAGGRTRYQAHFKRFPPDLTVGPFTHLAPTALPAERLESVARIAKFGIPGTDMPGHEYLSDNDIASLALWLSSKRSQPVPNR
jgi:cytochrome c oxidase cbb3-type subunit 2